MTSSPMEGQLDCLRGSLATLLESCAHLSAGARLQGLLASLPSSTTGDPGKMGPSGEPTDALVLIGQARASARLLGSWKVAGLPSELGPVLEDLEAEIGREVRREVGRSVYGLYVIIDPQVTGGREPVDVAMAALEGGARMVQLRDKARDKGQSLPLARSLRELCDRYDALLIINDHADVAALCGAHGLHVGQTDLPVDEARRVLEPRQIVGRSNHLLEEVLESLSQGADHVALGNVYRTSTKESIRDRPPLGPEAVRSAKKAVDVPLVAIGGIGEDNVEEVVRAGADAICVASAVGLAPDPKEASRRLVERIRRAGGKA